MNEILQPLFIITPVLLVLAIGIVVFVFQYQRRMLQHQEHLRHLQQLRQRQLLEATIQAQEEERGRIARDLHDEVGAMLALVKLNVHQLVSQPEKEHKGQQVKQMLDEVMGSVRQISHALMPVVLQKMGLYTALDTLKRIIPADAGLQLQVTSDNPEQRLAAKTELFLYRVVQELLSNTLKHAEASQIEIALQHQQELFTLQYQDNGIGFDYEAVQQPGSKAGLGIMNLQARLELLDGHLDVWSAANSGTKITISVPIS